MTSVEAIRSRIQWLIEKHEPNKVGSIDELMKKWKGKEKDLNKTLSEKFNEKCMLYKLNIILIIK